MVQRVQQSWSNLELGGIRNKIACFVWPIGHTHLEVNPQTMVRSWQHCRHSSAETYPSVGKSSESSRFTISRMILDAYFSDRPHVLSWRKIRSNSSQDVQPRPSTFMAGQQLLLQTRATIYNVGTNNDAATLEIITELWLVLLI